MENETQDQQINQTPVTSPSQPVSPAPKSRLSIIFGGVLLLLLMCGVAYYFVVSKNTSKQQVLSPSPIPTTSVQATSIPTQTISVIKLLDAWQLGTRMYSNPKIDITFEYPSFFELHETDIQKENADWQAKYKNDPNVKQPLYTSSFAASFSTPNQESAATQEICDNKMSVSVSKYDNNQNLSLYDFIADQHKTYPGDGQTETFDTYKKDLKPTDLPKQGSYIFEGIVGENPVKTVYFTNKGEVYTFGLIGNCDTGGQYTPDAAAVFDDMLKSIKYL